MKSYGLRDWSAVILQVQLCLRAILPTLSAEADVTGLTELLPTESAGLRYCSLFGNRAPKPEHKLVSCPWFRLDSCCYQEEVDSLRIYLNENPINLISCSLCSSLFDHRFWG
ncbi:Hypp9782 [Branchiostoma lanceolatum]|uniref:Hypp9782 protein n=1 Tax=Branchiostoma lanceolatum TaxID=7740 RepID=A0A8S4MPZ7_BRALA|nr:Hypp9782 [Branchiostoma lanceolatum]